MILSRIATALRQQNWAAVAIEFVIVIAGVVIGFQITEWRGEQANRENELTYLVRLHEDMVQSTCALQRNANVSSGWHTRARRTLDALLANDPEAIDDTGFELIASTRIRTSSLSRATLNELVNGGQMNLISDNELRARIAEAEARFNSLDELIQVLVDAQDSFVRDVQLRLRPVPGEVYTITYDFDALANDETFINALGHALRITHVNNVWLENLGEAADALRIEVAAAIGEDTGPLDCGLPEPTP
ncbi:hypothetical protein V0U79_06155 [Hyphobacterium sp. HN65]|uniref:Uncharacterized protein n=1 Tax=Hyphobacterium lacteum TaxID=3116575 RepID=A0ABU7LPW6_9PROT|nr:hypothetical protein [Hyphobacterium sp. HN65]MEE2525942.1 hypothetical protein [Hyphobacterium sp. HN65]